MSRENICTLWSQTDTLANVLSRSFYDELSFRYVIPDDQSRLRLLPGFFQVAILWSQRYGKIQTTPGVDGGALWIGPGSGFSLGRMMRTALEPIPFQWGWSNLRRGMNLAVHLDEVRRQLVPGPHWYLMAGTLIEPLLSRAGCDGLPWYVETFNEKHLTSYKRLGFRIVGGGNIPRGGPDFWALVKSPQTNS